MTEILVTLLSLIFSGRNKSCGWDLIFFSFVLYLYVKVKLGLEWVPLAQMCFPLLASDTQCQSYCTSSSLQSALELYAVLLQIALCVVVELLKAVSHPVVNLGACFCRGVHAA